MYNKTRHSGYKLTCHIVLVVKYRKRLITEDISRGLLRVLCGYNIEVIEWNYEEDHIHTIIKTPLDFNIIKTLNSYKSRSSREIRATYPQVRSKLWGGRFWKIGFFIETVGSNSIEVVKKYIQNQRG